MIQGTDIYTYPFSLHIYQLYTKCYWNFTYQDNKPNWHEYENNHLWILECGWGCSGSSGLNCYKCVAVAASLVVTFSLTQTLTSFIKIEQYNPIHQPPVSHMSATCWLHVSHMSAKCQPSVSQVSAKYQPSVSQVSAKCQRHFIHMSPTFQPHVSHMLATY